MTTMKYETKRTARGIHIRHPEGVLGGYTPVDYLTGDDKKNIWVMERWYILHGR